MIAVLSCDAESMFITMCDLDFRDEADLSVVAIRDGIRSENDISGWGSIAIDVNDERVAP